MYFIPQQFAIYYNFLYQSHILWPMKGVRYYSSYKESLHQQRFFFSLT